MKKLVFMVVALAVTVAGNGWAAEDEYVEPMLYSTAPSFGPERPCPHYSLPCRSRIAGWLEHMDKEAGAEEPTMRVALYGYGYRNARKASTAAHRAAASETKMAILGNEARALTMDEMQDVARAGISAFVTTAAEAKKAAEEAMDQAM